MAQCTHALDGDDVNSATHNSYDSHLLDQAKLAWKNANRCIGRAHWNSLHLLDYRNAKTPDEYFEALSEHIRFATNDGAIRSCISLFAPKRLENTSTDIKILNHQLIRYAGFNDKVGRIIGDPHSLQFTRFLLDHGWTPKEKNPFVVLPLALLCANEELFIYEWPKSIILEVPIEHPTLEWISNLGLKWYAVPIISDMDFKTKDENYSSAPFNGYYMGTEIGARNLADENRYNVLPIFADKMGLDTKQKYSLWKDRALIELNTAVLYSFQQAGVRITDHHTESKNHLAWERKMMSDECPITGDWSWLVPPISGSSSPLFHRSYHNIEKVPGFFYGDSFMLNTSFYNQLMLKQVHIQQ